MHGCDLTTTVFSQFIVDTIYFLSFHCSGFTTQVISITEDCICSGIFKGVLGHAPFDFNYLDNIRHCMLPVSYSDGTSNSVQVSYSAGNQSILSLLQWALFRQLSVRAVRTRVKNTQWNVLWDNPACRTLPITVKNYKQNTTDKHCVA